MGTSTVWHRVTWVNADACFHVSVKVHVFGALADDFFVIGPTGAAESGFKFYPGLKSDGNSLRTPAVMVITQTWGVTPAMFIHFFVVLTDTSVAAVGIAALQVPANFVVVGTLIKIVACFLVF